MIFNVYFDFQLIVQASVRFISSHVEYTPNIYSHYYMTYKVKQFGVSKERAWQENSKDESISKA